MIPLGSRSWHCGAVVHLYTWRNLLDVVQTPGVRFEDGCMMEHLVKGDAEEDYIQLKHRNKNTQVRFLLKQA